VDREVAGCKFQDERLGERFRKLLKQIGSAIGQAIPFACQDWANTKAAYRFFSNDRVDEEAILSGHFQATHDRFAATDGYVLVLHDTTEFSFKREKPELIGSTCKVKVKGEKGRSTFHTVCGILMHSSLVVTTEGLPLGLAAIKFWTRKKFKGRKALEKKINPTRVPIEEKESIRWPTNLRQSTNLLDAPERCVHITDREGDIYELFCEAREATLTLLYALVWIVWLVTASILSLPKWTKCASKDCTGLRFATGMVMLMKPYLKYDTAALKSFHRSESRDDIRL
jgi:hypothetical protein